MTRKIRVGFAAALLCICIGVWLWFHVVPATDIVTPTVRNPLPIDLSLKLGNTVRAMAIGGSVALGWDDKDGGGYLARAFDTLSSSNRTKFTLINKAVEGYGPTQYSSAFLNVLKTFKPNVLVISWGLLDDASNKTSISQFRQCILTEMTSALASGMYVLVVTPPVTEASYTVNMGLLEQYYMNNEISVAQSLHSSKVYVFDVFSQMKSYLNQHHQNIESYMADNWHPNSAGHALAGKLLAEDMQQQLFSTTGSSVQEATT